MAGSNGNYLPIRWEIRKKTFITAIISPTYKMQPNCSAVQIIIDSSNIIT